MKTKNALFHAIQETNEFFKNREIRENVNVGFSTFLKLE